MELKISTEISSEMFVLLGISEERATELLDKFDVIANQNGDPYLSNYGPTLADSLKQLASICNNNQELAFISFSYGAWCLENGLISKQENAMHEQVN